MTQSEVCSLEEKQLALTRALESHTFARSEQLKAFLRYVCSTEMLRPSAPLTEYVIGVEVLGRAEGYSPAEDSSVRTRAYELRQKLERLYTRELTDEPIQISIPKGTYFPKYLHRVEARTDHLATLSLHQSDAPVQADSVAQSSIKHPIWFTVVLVLAFAALASAVTWRLSRAASVRSDADSILAEAWGPLAEHEGTVALCLATPLTLVVGPSGHAVYGSKSYPAPDESYPIFKEHRPLADGATLGLTFTDNMIAVGTMSAALTAAKTLRNFGTAYQILPESVATVSALHGRNAILFGSPVDSQAISLALADMPLTIDFEPSLREFVVRDKATGRIYVPKKNVGGDFTEVYGLISVRTINDSDKRRIQSVVFSGITSVGVQGASEFFSSSSAMATLQTFLRKEDPSAFPACYQVMVRCTTTNLLLLSFEYFSHIVVHSAL